MAWDLRIDPVTGDLTSGIVTGTEEILQRVITRIMREQGEWFLATQAGIPWYRNGTGLLGSKSQEIIDMFVRNEVRNTAGVERILIMRSRYINREYALYMTLLLSTGLLVEVTLNNGELSWQITG